MKTKDEILAILSGKTLEELQRLVEPTVWQEPLPETILVCSRCAKNITAYGLNGETFITSYVNGVKYFHNNPDCDKI